MLAQYRVSWSTVGSTSTVGTCTNWAKWYQRREQDFTTQIGVKVPQTASKYGIRRRHSQPVTFNVAKHVLKGIIERMIDDAEIR